MDTNRDSCVQRLSRTQRRDLSMFNCCRLRRTRSHNFILGLNKFRVTGWLTIVSMSVVLTPSSIAHAGMFVQSARAGAVDQSDPEAVLRAFMIAMISNDAKTLSRLMIPNTDASVLWQGDEIPAEALTIVKEHLASTPIRRVRVGETITLPSGQSMVVSKNQLHEDRLLLTIQFTDDQTLSLYIVRSQGRWRVDATPIIDSRKSAAKRRSRERLTDRELNDVVSTLHSDQTIDQREGAMRLAQAEPKKGRSDVALALNPLLASKDLSVRRAAAAAACVWGTQENVATLLQLIDAEPDDVARTDAMIALAQVGDERVAESLARHLKKNREDAAAALAAMGPVAEKAVVVYVKDSDPLVRAEACQILNFIGTQSSVPIVRAATRDKDARVASAAQAALKSISARR